MKSFKLAAIGATLAIGLLASAPAQAQVWNFSWTDTAGDSSTGQFTTSGPGSPYAITGVSGAVNNTSLITGLSGYAGADNLLYSAAAGYADFAGISYSADNGIAYNLFYYAALDRVLLSTIDPVGYPQNGYELTSFSVSAVPEPATWAMLLFGLGGVGLAMRSRRRGVGAFSGAAAA